MNTRKFILDFVQKYSKDISFLDIDEIYKGACKNAKKMDPDVASTSTGAEQDERPKTSKRSAPKMRPKSGPYKKKAKVEVAQENSTEEVLSVDNQNESDPNDHHTPTESDPNNTGLPDAEKEEHTLEDHTPEDSNDEEQEEELDEEVQEEEGHDGDDENGSD